MMNHIRWAEELAPKVARICLCLAKDSAEVPSVAKTNEKIKSKIKMKNENEINTDASAAGAAAAASAATTVATTVKRW